MKTIIWLQIIVHQWVEKNTEKKAARVATKDDNKTKLATILHCLFILIFFAFKCNLDTGKRKMMG